jgi:hypothetical protein
MDGDGAMPERSGRNTATPIVLMDFEWHYAA